MKYQQGSRPLDDYPPCPQCGYDLPVVHANGYPAGTWLCFRCEIRFEADAP